MNTNQKIEIFHMENDEFTIADCMYFARNNARLNKPVNLNSPAYTEHNHADWEFSLDANSKLGFLLTELCDNCNNEHTKYALVSDTSSPESILKTGLLRRLPDDFSPEWFNRHNKKFYFTFGDSDGQPYFSNDYVLVYASSESQARLLFSLRYPNTPQGCLSCAFVYPEKEWKANVEKWYRHSSTHVAVPAATLYPTPDGDVNFFELMTPRHFNEEAEICSSGSAQRIEFR